MFTVLWHIWCGLSANLECRSEMCCTRLAANTGRKKSPKIAISAPSHNFVGYKPIFATKARTDNRKINLLGNNMSSTCCHNMVNFGPLTAEIGSTIWGTPANFNWFRVLVTLLYGISGNQLNFAAVNRGRHLCSAGGPSRWALAHILFFYSSIA